MTWKNILRVVLTRPISFLKSMTERGKNQENQWKKILVFTFDFSVCNFFRITKEKLLTLRTKDKVPLYNYEYLCNMFYV